jgi:parallel beta-helix repeat protein
MRLFLRLILAGVVLSGAVRGDTIFLTDFGGKADGTTDNGPALMKAFAYAKTHPGTVLHLGGVYHVLHSQAVFNAEKVAAFGDGISNFTIEEGEILLGGPFGALAFNKCPGLILRHLSFDYDPPILSQGKIVGSDRAHRTMTVVPDPGFPSPGSAAFNGGDWLTVHQPSGEYAFFYVAHISSATTSPDGRVTLTYDRPDLAQVIEGKTDLRYVRVKRAWGHLLVFSFCDQLRMEGCSIYGTSSFAGLFLFCNGATLVDNRICLREGSNRIVATCADGFDFIGARRGPDIERNLFDHLQDDNIVISLRGNRIKSHDGTQVQLASQSCTWYEPGDTIEVVTMGDGARRDYQVVATGPPLDIYRPPLLTLDRPLEGNIVEDGHAAAGDPPTLVFNKSWALTGTVIRQNHFQNTRRYSVFMGADGVLIEDNVMSNFTGAAILCSHTEDLRTPKTGLPFYFTTNLTIRNNSIAGAFAYGEGGRVFKGLPAGAIDSYDEKAAAIHIGDLHLAHDIDIENNTIHDSGAVGIHLANAANVTVSGNTIENPNRLNPLNRYGIWLEECPEPQVSGNQVSGSGVDVAVKMAP